MHSNVATETILVVGYDNDVRQFIAGILRSAGYEVSQAESPDAALEALRGGAVNLLLCNALMAGATGIELSLRAQELQPDLRVLLTTGQIRDDSIGGLKPERTALVEQPLRGDVLLSEVRRILSARP